MRCPYCKKIVADVPVHLDREPLCGKRHGSNLLDQLKALMATCDEADKLVRMVGVGQVDEKAKTDEK